MSVAVVAFTTVGHETGFEAWCDSCGSVAEVTAPLRLGDDGIDQARDSVERAAVMHEDYDHAAIGWDDADPILLGVLPASPEARVGSLLAPGMRRSPSWPARAVPSGGTSDLIAPPHRARRG